MFNRLTTLSHLVPALPAAALAVMGATAVLPALPSTAFAATVNQNSNYSSDWLNPTVIDPGTTQISGVADSLNVFQLSGLSAGAQSLNFHFSAADIYTSGNLTMGGTIVYSPTPFQYSWDDAGRTTYQVSYNSWEVGMPWAGSSGSLTSNVALNLGPDFAGGNLYLALVPWADAPLSYSMDYVSTGVTPPPEVPLPASNLLLLGALGLNGAGVWAMAGRRRQV